MKKIEEVDKNLKVENNIYKNNLTFTNVLEKPFEIFGVFYENGKFRRMPETIAKSVSEGVYYLHANTSGGRVRFKTDSTCIAITAKMENIARMSHFPLTGSAGFDLYYKEDNREHFFGTFVPPYTIEDSFEAKLQFDEQKLREITINFPLYSDVKELLIGIENNSELCSPDAYKYDKPVVYYGSSITQGGCASRPGNAYPAILSRKFNCDYINLGFSGNGKGELEIAEYIANLDMMMFVYDYDHNAPNKEHLEKTHKRMFEIVRSKQPKIPIIMISSVTMERFIDDVESRKKIIHNTFESAYNNGDKDVYFIDGSTMFNNYNDGGTVEGCHPNDYGFNCMANTIAETMKKLF